MPGFMDLTALLYSRQYHSDCSALESDIDIIHPFGQANPGEVNCGIKLAGYPGLSDANCCSHNRYICQKEGVSNN